MKGIKVACHTKIYQYLLKHPALDALQCYIKMHKNSDYCRKVACRDGLVMKCNTYGEKNKGKNIYLIEHGAPNKGFFAQYRELLKYLCYADRFAFYPVILWSKDLPYAENEEINGSENPFEYYFEQPMNISTAEALQSYNVFKSNECQLSDFYLNKESQNAENGYYISEELMDNFAKVSKKYIRLNRIVQEDFDEQIDKIINGKKTIGVHVRGTDYKKNYALHPTYVSSEEYIKKAREALESEQYEQIFLATDDKETVELFQKELKGKVVMYEDVLRAEGSTSVAFSQDNRNQHHYFLGLEVLRDMTTLAACDILIAGISQVSICARITKKSYGKEYDKVIIIDVGINQNLNYF